MVDFNSRAEAFEAVSKMGLFWQISLVLPILFWFGFTGFDFLNFSGFFPFLAADYVRWIYFLFCLIYIAVFSTKLMKVMNGGKSPTTWDMNRPNTIASYNAHTKNGTSFVIFDSLDLVNFSFFYFIPCIFLVFGFFLFFKNEQGVIVYLSIVVPLFCMLLQILFAKDVFKYCKEINVHVEESKKRLFVYIFLAIAFVFLSVVVAFFVRSSVPEIKMLPVSDGSLMTLYLDSNVLVDCMSGDRVCSRSFYEHGFAKVINEAEIYSILSEKKLFGLDNLELFLVSTNKNQYIGKDIVIRSRDFSFSGVCLPGDGRKSDYFDYVAPTWKESKLWNELQMENFSLLESKLWDSNVKFVRDGEDFYVGRETFAKYHNCLNNDFNSNSVCCIGLFE